MKKIIKSTLFVLRIIVPISLSCSNSEETITNVYYENGNIKSTFVTSGCDSTSITFFENGDTARVDFYMNNLRKRKVLYFPGNRINEIVEHTDSLKRQTVFHQSGEIELSTSFLRDTIIHGTQVGYHSNGQLAIRSRFENGMPFGDFEQYYPNGNPFIIAKNVGNGVHFLYDSTRTDSLKILYVNFEPVDTLSW